ncbi:hypothetical protein ACFT2C_20260 [Promicromonospora sp. NPDC057138]|uniref:hypothetical protein n=1 Tax=Promicromonospora sp. NPDC057138 TaxID=3346031 RepID=UPI00363B7B6D
MSSIRSGAFGYLVPFALSCEMFAIIGVLTDWPRVFEIVIVVLVLIAVFALVAIATDALAFATRGKDDEKDDGSVPEEATL